MLMTMFVDVHDNRSVPAEQEVTCSCSESHRDAEIHIVRHEDEHKEVTDDDLDHVKKCL